jgi:uncharacterized OsmC-like protein/pimeloyl-ACP methyl ester carboxylesterase
VTALSERVEFAGAHGAALAARLDRPAGPVRATALLAHCFTCSKDLFAVRRIAGALAGHGIAVLRFDFTGLGASGGEFASTNFSSNVADVVAAADFLRSRGEAPALLIGHSLGGAAVLAAAGEIPEARAVATIGAPADAEHVVQSFAADEARIEEEGEAEVTLAGRRFTIRRQFLEDLRGQRLGERVAALRRPLMILHAPRDETVGIENAAAIYAAAKHPKSFVSLDDADHLLTRHEDAAFVADVLAAWSGRYLPPSTAENEAGVRVTETGDGPFQVAMQTGPHAMLGDEPASVGGGGTGPSPYELLSMALGACTAMTLRMYARHKKLALGRVSVAVEHGRVHAADCAECVAREGRIDRFERVISVEGAVDAALADKLVEIAAKCPVHRTLEAEAVVVTRLAEDR